MTGASPRQRESSALRGVYRANSRRGAHDDANVWFNLTRVDGAYAYGYYCTNPQGVPDETAPLAKLRLNAARTAPEGFRPRPGKKAAKAS